MERKEVRINSDFRPLGVFFSLSYWNALYSPYLAGIFKWIERLSLKLAISILAVLALFAIVIGIKRPKTFKLSLPYAVFTSGFGGMIFDLAIIFTFQTLYGYLYYQISASRFLLIMHVAPTKYKETKHISLEIVEARR